MSFYSWVKVKDLQKNYSDKELLNRINEYEQKLNNDILLLKGNMIDAYYSNDINTNISNISIYLTFIRLDKEKLERFIYIQTAREDKENTLFFNHLGLDTKYDLEEDIRSNERSLNGIREKLLILTCIKFKEKDKNNKCVGESNDEMEYLAYDYQNEISEKLDYYLECVSNIVRDNIILENIESFSDEEKEYQENNKTNIENNSIDDNTNKLVNSSTSENIED